MIAVSKTNTGLVRTKNEDAVLMDPPDLFAIADGMGGYAAGEIASVETIRVLQQEKSAFGGLTGDGLCSALKSAADKANSHLRGIVCKMPDYEGMGTTLVAVYLASDGKAYVLNIGDSRLYLWRSGELKQITHDHSYVAELVSKGDITTDEARRHPQRNVILRAVGADEDLESDVFSFKLAANDRLLLCSDGLTDMASDEEIAKVLLQADAEKAAGDLIELALNNGGRDNVSVILLDLGDLGAEEM